MYFAFNLQGLNDDLEVKEAYRSVFFLNFYQRSTDEEYERFVSTVKNTSAEVYGYNYDTDESVCICQSHICILINKTIWLIF